MSKDEIVSLLQSMSFVHREKSAINDVMMTSNKRF